MKKTIKDYDLQDKKVIIRCDFNVPFQGNVITDDTKIISSLETIRYALDRHAKVILMSHLGKVKTEEDKEKNSLYFVSKKLEELLGQKVYFCRKTHGEELEKMIESLLSGEVLLMENTRYEDVPLKKESSCEEELSKYWASLGDIFINDAYGSSHRAHASVCGIPKYLPSGMGFLLEREVKCLEEILKEDTHPFVVVMGGKKIEDKITLTENLLQKCDKLLIGGGMANTFLLAQGKPIGSSIYHEDSLEFCTRILKEYSDKIVLPIDVIVSTNIENEGRCAWIEEIKEGESCFDIGLETRKIFEEILKNAKRVIVNGPMGVFERESFQEGTKSIYSVLRKNQVKTLIGGGDTTYSVHKLGFENAFYHVSTGGGATLEYLEGKTLPGIEVIDEKGE